MKTWSKVIGNSRFYLAAALLNISSVLFLWLMSGPASTSVSVMAMPITTQKVVRKVEPVYGKPTRLIIPSLNLTLTIDEGNYNPADSTWSISGYNAQFAMPTMLANDQEGNTLVYGHNNKYVFGPLKALSPGATAEIQTDKGHIFYYTYQSSEVVAPEDLSIFNYQGPPTLTLQTCTGSWHEQRRLSHFKFDHVDRFNPNAEVERQNREKLITSLDSLSNPAYPEASKLPNQY